MVTTQSVRWVDTATRNSFTLYVLGRGSEFTVCFPRLQKSAEMLMASHGASALPLQAGGLRIMVVDDNVDAAAMLALFLELNRHQVTVEHHPLLELQRVVLEPFDTFLLDIGLPGDGWPKQV